MNNKTKYLIVGIIIVAIIGIVTYVLLRTSKSSPISNIPKVTETTTKTGLDWQGIGAGLSAFTGGAGIGGLFGKK